jgi:hypothetical protein
MEICNWRICMYVDKKWLYDVSFLGKKNIYDKVGVKKYTKTLRQKTHGKIIVKYNKPHNVAHNRQIQHQKMAPQLSKDWHQEPMLLL